MTSKEYIAIREFYGKHANIAMRGHIWLHSKAIRHIKKPSDALQLWSNKKKALYLNPKTMRVNGDYLMMADRFSGLIKIHRKWIQAVLLYHYNH